jgi:hypothetical protein
MDADVAPMAGIVDDDLDEAFQIDQLTPARPSASIRPASPTRSVNRAQVNRLAEGQSQDLGVVSREKMRTAELGQGPVGTFDVGGDGSASPCLGVTGSDDEGQAAMAMRTSCLC